MKKFVEKLILISGKDSNEEVVLYGLETMLDGVVSIIVFIILGLAFDKLLYTVLFLVFSSLITRSTGGYHASSRLGCGVITCILFYIAVFIPDRLQSCLSIELFCFLGSLGIAVVWLLAPVVHPDKPLSTQLTDRNRKTARVLVSILMGIEVFLFERCTAMAIALWINQIEVAISALIGWWAYHKKGGAYYEEENGNPCD